MNTSKLLSCGRGLILGSVLSIAVGLTSANAEVVHYPENFTWSSMSSEIKERHQFLVGKPMPWVELSEWHNGELKKEDFEGKVVLVDLWATWCGPCIAGIPKLNAYQEKYADKDFKILAICTSRSGQERLAEIVKTHDVKYPVARDHTLDAEKVWGVKFYPTYAVVGKDGLIKVVGINPEYIEHVVQAELSGEGAAKFAEPKGDGIGAPSEFLEGDTGRRNTLSKMRMTDVPEIKLTNWMNSEAMTNESLKGKIVVLDFWATWCGPCIASIPKNNEIAEKYAEKGVVFIGVCHPRGSDKMAETAEMNDIKFPIAVDEGGTLANALMVDGYPDYYIIDRDGKIWGADIQNSKVADALDYLLNLESATAMVE